MYKLMFGVSGGSLAALCALGIAYAYIENAVMYALAITAGTVFYHFAMRLAVGYAIHGIFRNRMRGTLWWFRERAFEPALYRLLRVRRWKGRVPTYVPGFFAVSERTTDQLIGATCQAEVVHEVIMVLSFVPLLFIVWFGEPVVFVLTSVGAALLDAVFVMVQRFNRPRLVKLAEREARRKTR